MSEPEKKPAGASGGPGFPVEAARPDGGPSPRQIILEAKKLSKVFPSGRENLHILEELDLEVAKGRSMAILGASGSGKSTLLYILGGLEKPTAGEVLFEGRNIFASGEESLAAWRNKTIGFVFQFHHLLGDFTTLENAAMPARLAGLGPSEAMAKALPLLERVGLADRLDHKPGELSGGEQQRVALARALVMEPKILLADEPTGNLDGKNAGSVNDLILELVREKGLAAVIVTHNSQLAALVDEPLELSAGLLKKTNTKS